MTTLYVAGDLHGQWDHVDAAFVESQEAVTIFTGDLGDEDVALARRVAALRCEKGVMLGNHDAWFAMRGRTSQERVRAQLDTLGDAFLGYGCRPVAGGVLALAGARPFSWGGGWRSFAPFYEELFGVATDEQSSAAMRAAVARVPELPLVFVGHNGPHGLGEGADAIFGRDFLRPYTDFGDRDFALALRLVTEQDGRRVLATVAGHMHARTMMGTPRRRVVVDRGITHVNAAIVPRHVRGLRHFVRLVIEDGRVRADDVWVNGLAEIAEVHSLL